jgi:hypothetical protein
MDTLIYYNRMFRFCFCFCKEFGAEKRNKKKEKDCRDSEIKPKNYQLWWYFVNINVIKLVHHGL